MYLETFLADFAVFRVFWEISRDFAEMPEFRAPANTRNIRSPGEISASEAVHHLIRHLKSRLRPNGHPVARGSYDLLAGN